MVDAFYGSVFRYFDVIDRFVPLTIFDELPRIAVWRRRLAERPSVVAAVDASYGDLLTEFLLAKRSHLSTLINSAQ
jgi:glutathione S-transferase